MALMIWVEGLPTALIALISAASHELGHFMAISLCRAEVKSVDIGLLGAKIKYCGEHTSYRQDIAVSLGGVAVNLLLAAAGCICFKFAANEYVLMMIFANLALAFVNLLPISFLDGGQLLRAYSLMHHDLEKADSICIFGDFAGRTALIIANMLLIALSGGNMGLCILMIIQLMSMICG